MKMKMQLICEVNRVEPGPRPLACDSPSLSKSLSLHLHHTASSLESQTDHQCSSRTRSSSRKIMASTSGASTPRVRSRSRSKRSTTNLANLRLAPLSTKYEASKGDTLPLKSPLRTPYDADNSADYVRRHPSYLVGQSAPTTPGILSRSNSKRHLGGGLSRRGSLYDQGEDGDADGENENAAPAISYAIAGPGTRRDSNPRAEIASGQLGPKAKSEAALLPKQSHPPQTRSNRNSAYNPRGRRSGAATPTQKRENDSWLTHTGAITSALVREDKGQSYITTRQSATSLAPESTDEEDDEDEDNYETMAQLAASTAGMHKHSYSYSSYASYDGTLSPVSTRYGQGQTRSAWGSRYGSRPQSKRGSRLGSPVGTRTPMQRRRSSSGYFDQYDGAPQTLTEQHAEHNEAESDDDDHQVLARADGFGLGNVVDRVMNFNLFGPSNTDAETTDDESSSIRKVSNETAEQAQKRMEAEKERRRLEKDKLTKQAGPAPLSKGKEVSAGWQDASWLLSVAAKALF